MNEELLLDMLREYEKKLQTLMSEEEYMLFAEDVARECFAKDVNRLPDDHPIKIMLDDPDTFRMITGDDGYLHLDEGSKDEE